MDVLEVDHAPEPVSTLHRHLSPDKLAAVRLVSAAQQNPYIKAFIVSDPVTAEHHTDTHVISPKTKKNGLVKSSKLLPINKITFMVTSLVRPAILVVTTVVNRAQAIV